MQKSLRRRGGGAHLVAVMIAPMTGQATQAEAADPPQGLPVHNSCIDSGDVGVCSRSSSSSDVCDARPYILVEASRTTAPLLLLLAEAMWLEEANGHKRANDVVVIADNNNNTAVDPAEIVETVTTSW